MFRRSLFGRRFDDLFREIEEEMRDVERRVQSMVESPDPNGSEPKVYGWTVRVGPDGVPHVQEWGNVGRSDAELSEGWREPFVTSVLDDEEQVVRFTAELPGITKDDIDIEATPDGLRLEARGDDRRYRTTIPVDAELDPDTAAAKYNNGILEVTVGLREHHDPDARTIEVE